MGFKVRKIRKTRHLKFKRTAKRAIKNYLKNSKKHITYKKLSIVVGFLIVGLFFLLVFKACMFVKELSFKDVFLTLLNRPVQTDEHNHTNFLLLGRGGGLHDGANLTDSIMIVSIDTKDHTAAIVSIPRDFWIDTEDEDWLVEQGITGTRINKLVEHTLDNEQTEEEGIALLEEKIEKNFNLELHYHALIDFKGFEEVIDGIGGIEVNVPETLYDPLFPKDGTYDFEPFYISAGVQNLDGKTALKYARSRKTTSDFDRAKRQQQVLESVKGKLLSSEVLLSKTKIKNLFQTYEENVLTNLELFEFVYLAKLARRFDTSAVAHGVINDDPYSIGGVLYTPERKYFGGAFVLIPQTNTNEEMERFMNYTLYTPEILINRSPIRMLNGTKVPGLAFDGLNHIERYGFDVISFSNAESKDFEENVIYYRSANYDQATVEKLEEMFGVKAQSAEGTPYATNEYESTADIFVILGQKFADYKEANPKLFY